MRCLHCDKRCTSSHVCIAQLRAELATAQERASKEHETHDSLLLEVSSYRSGMIAAEERLATVTTERDARGVDLVELELQWQAERAAHAETRKALEEERAANANAEQVSDALMDTRAELAKAKARVDTLKVLAISGMHTLLHVDADMTERVECAKAIAEPCGHPWPPYQEEEDEDG